MADSKHVKRVSFSTAADVQHFQYVPCFCEVLSLYFKKKKGNVINVISKMWYQKYSFKCIIWLLFYNNLIVKVLFIHHLITITYFIIYFNYFIYWCLCLCKYMYLVFYTATKSGSSSWSGSVLLSVESRGCHEWLFYFSISLMLTLLIVLAVKCKKIVKIPVTRVISLVRIPNNTQLTLMYDKEKNKILTFYNLKAASFSSWIIWLNCTNGSHAWDVIWSLHSKIWL